MCDDPISTDVPPEMAELFAQAEGRVNAYFATACKDSVAGKFYLGGDRHMLLRGDALGVEFMTALRSVCGDNELARRTANALLFDLGYAIGSADAKTFIRKMNLETPIEKLAVGPSYFANSGLGRVQILEGSRATCDDDFLLRYRHKNAIEAESWIAQGEKLTCPGCILACGYSSGWCSVAFERSLIAVEVTCVAAGDEHCEFVMAPPERMDAYLEPFRERHTLHIPRLFGRLGYDKKMHALAYRDSLTGVSNRAYLTEFAEGVLDAARGQDRQMAVFHIDMDHFKDINDSYGHAAGDHLLVISAQRIRSALKDGEVVARVGGDEFIVIMPGDDAEDFRARARTLQKALLKKIDYEGITLRTGGSIGISMFPKDGRDLGALMVNADLALYDVKQNGRGSFRFFDVEMRRTLDLRRQLEDELRHALDLDELVPFFQPQVDLSTQRVTGVECLVRWLHTSKGSIPPGEFLPVAVESGEMVRLGRQLIRKAIRQAAAWRRMGLNFGCLGINASVQELREADFVAWILETAGEYGLPLNQLSIELLETVMVDDVKLGLSEKLKELRAAGVKIELDDFGTGYASLRQVNPEEIDRLKIDRSFITDIDTNQQNAMIVRSIVGLATSLGMEVIAEGAETADELAILARLGCHTVQGYGVARPMSAGEFAAWMGSFEWGGPAKPARLANAG